MAQSTFQQINRATCQFEKSALTVESSWQRCFQIVKTWYIEVWNFSAIMCSMCYSLKDKFSSNNILGLICIKALGVALGIAVLIVSCSVHQFDPHRNLSVKCLNNSLVYYNPLVLTTVLFIYEQQ